MVHVRAVSRSRSIQCSQLFTQTVFGLPATSLRFVADPRTLVRCIVLGTLRLRNT